MPTSHASYRGDGLKNGKYPVGLAQSSPGVTSRRKGSPFHSPMSSPNLSPAGSPRGSVFSLDAVAEDRTSLQEDDIRSGSVPAQSMGEHRHRRSGSVLGLNVLCW